MVPQSPSAPVSQCDGMLGNWRLGHQQMYTITSLPFYNHPPDVRYRLRKDALRTPLQ